ncbi:hypothetical protein L1987_36302 [Smallanthus sonchifolius]|uniref:Uncharacterized protein n=1 Tax=Smallanthus sonchifolius TaxID=185202 RepID=A0ACB9HDP4_9ASTR|nr:hypothetical protein L1987_36302 [Smallanthus sonchifolius]
MNANECRCQRLTPFLCCVLLTGIFLVWSKMLKTEVVSNCFKGLLNSELLLCYWYSKLYYRLFLCRCETTSLSVCLAYISISFPLLKSKSNKFRMGILSLISGRAGPSGFGSASTAQQISDSIDASDLTIIITGGASGIGLETTRVLATRGAHVIIAARNTKAANEAKQAILENHENAKIDVLELDLSSLKSVKAFADSFKALNLPLNILINNAGVMFCPYQLSQDGIEMQFATNHLGHFHLTNLLLDKMKETAATTGIEGRIVNLSSVAHLYTYEEGIRFDKINDKDSYSDKKAYGQSKLANILHANELSRRLKKEGANITVNSVHPGLIMTDLMRHSFVLMRILKLLTYILWKNVPQGAATSCYVALYPDLKGVSGKYFVDCNEYPASNFATDPELAKKLWDYSQNLVKSL